MSKMILVVFLLLSYSGGFSQTLNWKFKVKSAITAKVLVVDSLVYTCGSDGFLYVLNVKNGKLQWKYDAGGALYRTGVIHDNLIYIQTLYDLHAVNIYTHKADTVFRSTYGAPLVENGILYYGDRQNTFRAMKVANDSVLWTFRSSSCFHSRPVISNDLIYVCDGTDSVFALNKNTGKLIWGYGETVEFFGGHPVVYEDYLFIAHYNKKIYAFDKNTGEIKWTFLTKGTYNSEAVVLDGKVYICSTDKNFYTIDLVTGKKLEQFTADEMIQSTPAIDNGLAFFGSGKFLYAFEIKTKRVRWKFACTYPVYSDPLVLGNSVIFGGNDGYLYSVKFR